jgi:hypothetical protein
MNEFTIEDNGLKIAFFRTAGADRWQLAIGLQDDVDACETWRPLLTSVLDSSDIAWPAFPPLQELLPGTHNNRPSVQLVGMAGKHHWSLSVAWQMEPAQWLFDFACRCESPPGPGQAAFAFASQSLLEVRPHAIVLQSADGRRSLTIITNGLPDVESAITCTPAGNPSSMHEIKITGTTPGKTTGRQTLRWYFGVRVA